METWFAKVYTFFIYGLAWALMVLVVAPLLIYLYSKLAGFGWQRGRHKAITVDWERLTKEEEEREHVEKEA